MKATEAKLLDFLKKSPQFIIPIYQRTYSWAASECRQLWTDVVRAGEQEGVSVHFVGSIVYIEQGHFQVMHQPPLLVIDGQQRLTTVTLLLAALAEALGDQEPFDGFSRRKLRNYYLLNPEESGERHYKLLLSQTDKDSLTAVVGEQELPKPHSLRIDENYRLFRELIASRKSDLVAVCRGLAKLMIVDIALSRDHDNPQLIFESMNSTGRELSQADLIRNFVLMGLEPTLQTQLYEHYWRPMEVEFGQEAYGTHFDAFMRHYLTVRTGEIPNVGAVYEAFKAYARTEDVRAAGVEAMVKDLRAFARYFCAMALGAEPDTQLARAFHDLRELKVDVAYPFLLELYDDFAKGHLPLDDFVVAVRLVESYVFRRAICAIPTNSMNKTFATFGRTLRKHRYLESIKAHFLLLPSYRRFPGDDEFHRDVQVRDLYHFRSRTYWLRKLENEGRKERVVVDDYTIEHIMPQNENLSNAWKAALGSEWERVQQTWLHTLGNLTLTGYNSEYSDRAFSEKRDMKGGFAQSPLRLNEELGQEGDWNEEAIIRRATRLADETLKVWPAPKLTDAALSEYRPKISGATAFTIQNHPNLLLPTMRPIFEAFRKEVLALDPAVTEEFKALYVAYKAETNFVDIVPQVSRLRLTLNMAFPELNDPRGIATDVTGKGHWGNGCVEVPLANLAELPYVIGLVRQSLELQMGTAGSA